MTAGSIFPALSLDRTVVPWDRRLLDLTPVEDRAGVHWKREDYFAPLGYGGINGAKLRQCIFLIGRAAANGARVVVTGASVKSPQLSMTTAVARHFGLRTVIIVGSPRQGSAVRHPNVAIAAALGADLVLANIAYNPALQAKAKAVAAATADSFLLEYGITTSITSWVEPFHALGGHQAQNIPPDVTTLYLPAGSCNTCVSVLYGLAAHRPPALRRVVLFGIGPTRLAWIHERLAQIEGASHLRPRRLFRRAFHSWPELAAAQDADVLPARDAITLEHFDLHTTRFASYQDEMPFRYAGIDFHPTYEGKVMTYLDRHRARFPGFFAPVAGERAMFWIVGSPPSMAAMGAALRPVLDRLPSRGAA